MRKRRNPVHETMREQLPQKRKFQKMKKFEELRLEKIHKSQPLIALNPRVSQSTPGWKPPSNSNESNDFYYKCATPCYISKECPKDIKQGKKHV